MAGRRQGTADVVGKAKVKTQKATSSKPISKPAALFAVLSDMDSQNVITAVDLTKESAKPIGARHAIRCIVADAGIRFRRTAFFKMSKSKIGSLFWDGLRKVTGRW